MEQQPNIQYRASAKASGIIESRAVTHNGAINLKLSTPRELGGAGGDGTNPEELLAAGYSACFLSASKVVSTKEKIPLAAETSVDGEVGIGAASNGYGLEVELKISIPGVERERAQALIESADQVWPYANVSGEHFKIKLTLV